jgi:hypothetical protein
VQRYGSTLIGGNWNAIARRGGLELWSNSKRFFAIVQPSILLWLEARPPYPCTNHNRGSAGAIGIESPMAAQGLQDSSSRVPVVSFFNGFNCISSVIRRAMIENKYRGSCFAGPTIALGRGYRATKRPHERRLSWGIGPNFEPRFPKGKGSCDYPK